jgi:hypothetical protein
MQVVADRPPHRFSKRRRARFSSCEERLIPRVRSSSFPSPSLSPAHASTSSLSRSLSLFLRTLPLEFDCPVMVCDMTELDIGEDADSWYADTELQLPASAPLTDVTHY